MSANMAGKVQEKMLLQNTDRGRPYPVQPGGGGGSLSKHTDIGGRKLVRAQQQNCENWFDPRQRPRSVGTSLKSPLVCWGIMDDGRTLELCCLSRFFLGVGGRVYLITNSNMVLMLCQPAAV